MPNENDNPNNEIPNGKGKENIQPARNARLTRSPQPYHRRKDHIHDAAYEPNHLRALTKDTIVEAGPCYSTASNGRRHHHTRPPYSTSPSDSGTEADTESGAILKGLPAPPVRWRKGLRIGKDEGTASPLLTPSYLDDDERRSAIERSLRNSPTARNAAAINDEILKIREKFTKQRRAEFLRRTSEIALLVLVGYVACSKNLAALQRVWIAGFVSHLSVVLGIYFAYPIRLFNLHQSQKGHDSRSWKFLRIPAAFDPATLLYPVLIPLFVALSIAPSNHAVLVPNLVLSIASIPRAIMPIHDDFLGHSSFHWMSSLIPLLGSRLFGQIASDTEASSKQYLAILTDQETFTLLFPLHQALLGTVGYLTTTSLLPAELQLLSTAMINALLLSVSPQALILKTLLWIGGIAIYILCGRVLHWGVALARTPSWRFRHPRLRAREGSVLLSAIDDCFNRKLSEWVSRHTESEESSDEGKAHRIVGTRLNGRRKELKLIVPESFESIEKSETLLSARDHGLLVANLSLGRPPESPEPIRKSQRRYTLPSYVTTKSPGSVQRRQKPFRKPHSVTAGRSSWTSLTSAQADATKWVFAFYVYATIFIIIALPIRKYISRYALNSHEPIGWAVGFLLGHIPLFRLYTLRICLDDWIPLPEPYNMYIEIPRSRAISFEQHFQGAANVRLILCGYCLILIAAGLATVFQLKDSVEVDTRRKVFHGMMVAMFLPSTFVDPTFISLALILVLAIFLLLDLFRASQLSPVSKPLTRFLAPYVDGRDYKGPVIVSHIFLLIGCATPLWLSLAASGRTGDTPWEGWGVPHRDLSMISGVICVGMGDAAASLIGRRYGRHRWCWSGGKSLEGSLAFALAVILGLCLGRAWLLLGGWPGDSGDPWSLTLSKAAVAATGASLTEAILTGGNDNVVVPVILWLLVRGLQI